MKSISIAICIVVSFIQSCSGQNHSIDSVIAKCDTANFSALENIAIHFRSRGHRLNTSIYFVSTLDGPCGPYSVEFDDENNSVVEIKNSLVLSSCEEDYLSTSEIERYIKAYVAYHLCVLFVDKEGNVYINPSEQEPPVFLRKAPDSCPKDLDKFKLYEGNWYIRK